MTTVLTRKIPTRAAVAVAVLTLVVSLVSGRERPELAAASATDESARAAAGAADLDPEKLKRPAPQPSQPGTDPFAAPPPAAPPAQVQQTPPAPTAPALPFRYVGRAVEDGRIAVFLQRGNENYSVVQGEHAGRDYRVEQITDAAVTFTYLPLGARQTLAVPEKAGS